MDHLAVLHALHRDARQDGLHNRLLLWGHCTDPDLLASILRDRVEVSGPLPWRALRTGPGGSLVVASPRRMAGVVLDVFDRYHLGPIAGVAVERRPNKGPKTFVGCTLWPKRWTFLENLDSTASDAFASMPPDARALWEGFGTTPLRVFASAHERMEDEADLARTRPADSGF